jgi:hypothetical protein
MFQIAAETPIAPSVCKRCEHNGRGEKRDEQSLHCVTRARRFDGAPQRLGELEEAQEVEPLKRTLKDGDADVLV